MDALFYILSGSAIIMMLFAWYKISVLRKKIPGGVMKSTTNVLAEFIGLFTIGYIALPFFPMLPQISRDILISVVFLFAAIFTIIVINLFYMIVVDLGL